MVGLVSTIVEMLCEGWVSRRTFHERQLLCVVVGVVSAWGSDSTCMVLGDNLGDRGLLCEGRETGFIVEIDSCA